MTSSCPNCNQTVLPTDTMCWHCGYDLATQAANQKAAPSATTAVSPSSTPSMSAVFIYGGVTAVLMLALLLTMRRLGQQPLVLLNPETNVNSGWQPITDQAIQYTLDMPPTWQSWEAHHPQQRDMFADLLANETQLATAVTPLGTAVSDMDILMIIMSEQSEQMSRLPGFVIVAQSQELGQLSLDDTIALAQQQNRTTEITEITKFSSFIGDVRAAISLKMPQTPDHLSCQQHIVTGTAETFVLAACAPEARYGVYKEPLGKILSSFQILR